MNFCDKLAFIEQCRKDLQNLCNFLDPYLPLANIHNTNFITHNYWEQVPPLIREELSELREDQLAGLLLKYDCEKVESQQTPEYWQSSMDMALSCHEMSKDGILTVSSEKPLSWPHLDLKSFVCAAQQFCMDRLPFSALSEHAMEQISALHGEDMFIGNSMGGKKAHEVKAMASLCAVIAKEEGIGHVVDLGSGKGYLPTTLALQHKLKVLGIDSNEGNTHGAIKRRDRLEKQWNGLVRWEEQKSSVIATKESKGVQQLLEPDSQASIVDANHTVREATSATSFERAAAEYTPITAFIAANDNLSSNIHAHFGNVKVLLSGLHTCGNLAATMARLFVQSSEAKVMLNVGCCYHLLDEQFSRNPFLSDDDPDPPPHFPLSHFLIDKKFALGRNCRILAMQAMEKAASGRGGDGLDIALYWRALLQKILVDKHAYWKKSWIVGKIAHKCSNFHQYVHKALSRLQINHTTKDEQIAEYLDRYEATRKQMAAFFQLRAALAPAIESLVTLDRCLYLLEQDCIESVYVHRLFDPVISPRCSCIIAWQK